MPRPSTPVLYLVHGWGFAPDFWTPLITALNAAQPGLDILTADLGYFGPARFPAPPPDRPVLAVGHSLGLGALLRRPFPWAGLAAICAFPRFTKGPDFPYGIHPRLLRAMRQRLEREPAATLADFAARCGLPGYAPQGLDHAAALAGLDLLASLDELHNPALTRAPLLALAASDDAIVPLAMTQDWLAARPEAHKMIFQTGGHALPRSRPADMARELLNFARQAL